MLTPKRAQERVVKTPTIWLSVGKFFKEPDTKLAWQGALELAALGETFQAKNLSVMRIRRFVKAMKSEAVREYLKLYPKWFKHFEYLTHEYTGV